MLKLNIEEPEYLTRVCHALSSKLRIEIIRALENKTLSCLELSRKLDYPLSTISVNVRVLEEAGVIYTKLLPARNGSKKLCTLTINDVGIVLFQHRSSFEPGDEKVYETEIPIGNYMDFKVFPTCGMVSKIIHEECAEHWDSDILFYDPRRIDAELIWFRCGYLEYRIPLTHVPVKEIHSISFDAEICSEAPGYNNVYTSDITCWINGHEIGTWRSPGDFGERPGKYTPDYWGATNTQYGLHTKWEVSNKNTTINGEVVSDRVVKSLDLEETPYVTFRIGVKPNAEYVGGMCLFSKKFGDYPQDIIMQIRCKSENDDT